MARASLILPGLLDQGLALETVVHVAIRASRREWKNNPLRAISVSHCRDVGYAC
jgi:hypothetical protein